MKASISRERPKECRKKDRRGKDKSRKVVSRNSLLDRGGRFTEERCRATSVAPSNPLESLAVAWSPPQSGRHGVGPGSGGRAP